MEMIADILLVAGALGAGLYCFVLARRLNRFNDLEKGVGGAVAVLSAQVDELNKTLTIARQASDNSGSTLENLTVRAESVAQRLELMMASMHDLAPQPATVRSREDLNQEDPKTPKPVPPTPAPKGVMFMRHDRSNDGVAT